MTVTEPVLKPTAELTMARQFVIKIGNRPGQLAHLARALAMRGINIEHLSLMGTGDQASVFLIADDSDQLRNVLHCLGHPYVEGDAMVIDVADTPGGLADVAERLAAAGVNILGTLEVGRSPGVIEMAFTVDDEVRARKALRQELVAAGH